MMVGPRSASRTALSLWLVLALGLPVLAPPAAAAASDDDIPGVVLAGQSVSGSLNDATDADDVYAIALEEGDSFTATLTADPGTDFDLLLFGPDASSVIGTAPAIAEGPRQTYPDVLRFAATHPGTYYLDVQAFLGSGGYTIETTKAVGPVPLPTDDNISPDLPVLPEQGVGLLDDITDPDDVYRVYLSAGQVFSVTIGWTDAGADSSFEARLYGPHASDVTQDATLAVSSYDPSAEPPQAVLTYTAPEDGYYYLDLYALTGSGAYLITHTVETPASDVRLDASMPARVTWGKGVTLTATLTADGAPLPGEELSIQSRPVGAGAFSQEATMATGAGGVATCTVFPTRPTEYRVFLAAATGREETTSPVLKCTTYASLTMPSVRKTTFRVGETFVAAGYLKPRHRAGGRDVRVYVQRYERQSNGSYKWVTRRMVYAKLVNYGSYSKYSCSTSLPSRGKWRLRAYVIGNSSHVSTWSAARSLTAR